MNLVETFIDYRVGTEYIFHISKVYKVNVQIKE